MSVFRQYPNQPIRPNGIAPFQTPASGFYPFDGSTPQQLVRAVEGRATLAAPGIAALLPAPVSQVPPVMVMAAAYVRSPTPIQLPAPGPAVIDDSDLIVCGDATQPIAPYIRVPTPWVNRPANGIAALLAPTIPYVPAGLSSRVSAAPSYPTQVITYDVAQFFGTALGIPLPQAANQAAAYLRVPATPVQQLQSEIAPLIPVATDAPLAQPPNQAAAYLRVPATPVQQLLSEIAPLVPVAADVPLPRTQISTAAFVRMAWPVLQLESEIASLLPQVAPFIFATPIPMPAREQRAPLVLSSVYTPAAVPFVYLPPTPLLGLYARLAFKWPQPWVGQAALVPDAPAILVPISGQTASVYGAVSVTVYGPTSTTVNG